MITDDDITLISRLLDGELSGDEARQLKERLLQEPELREMHDTLKGNNGLLKDMTDKIDHEPMPDAILDQLDSHLAEVEADLNQLDAEMDKLAGGGGFNWQAIAAAGLIALVGTGLVFNQESAPTLAEALNETHSGDRIEIESGQFEVVATFATESGWCREYVTFDTRAVACREGENWNTVVSEAYTPAADGSYLPAGTGSAVQDFVLDHMQGRPADRAMEQSLLEAW